MTFHGLPPPERERLIALALSATDVVYGLGAFFKPSFLAERGWRAVIVESDFTDAGGCVSTPLRERGIAEVACVGLTDYVLDAFRVGCRHEDLKRIHDEYVEPSYVVTDDLRSFCLVSDSDYYWGFAGDADLVAQVFGGDVPAGLDAFEVENAPYLESDWDHHVRIGTMLRAYLTICRDSWAASPPARIDR